MLFGVAVWSDQLTQGKPLQLSTGSVVPLQCPTVVVHSSAVQCVPPHCLSPSPPVLAAAGQ